MIYQHMFKNGGSVRIDEEFYEPQNKAVPTIFFAFQENGMIRTVGAALFDVELDLLPEIYDAIGIYLGKETKKLKDKRCDKCGEMYSPSSGNQKTCLQCKGK